MGIENSPEGVVSVELSPEPQMAAELTELTTAVRRRPCRKVVVDFSGAELVTSSSLAQLLRLRKVLLAQGAALVLCGVKPPAKGVFKVTALDKVFQFA